MSDRLVRCKFNWTIKEGDLTRFMSNFIQTNETRKAISLEDLLNPDACLVLEAEGRQESCEQTISVNPFFQVVKLAILAECSRIESFLGRIPEYNQTHDGRLVFDDGSRLYRFDLVFKANGASNFMFRYICPRHQPLCLYRVYLVLERNANPLISSSILNRAMIADRVDDSKLSERAARCKEFLLGTICSNNNQIFHDTSNYNIANAVPAAGQSTVPDPAGTSDDRRPGHPLGETALVKQYIDQKFAALEAKIDTRLEALESRQNEKLDQMLALLKGFSIDKQT